MDVFEVHRRLLSDYDSFTTSLVQVREPRIAAYLEAERAEGVRWPEPWLSLNPNFALGGMIADAVADGLLHPDCERVFRVKTDPDDPGARSLTLYEHQRAAIETAADGNSYVLTTGTGSGKSLTYLVPIVDSVLRAPSSQRVKAIVVYPMNALANSQRMELEKFLDWGFPMEGRLVSYDRYTGQESPAERDRIMEDKPDILLTNYMMLEYMLTRPEERRRLIGAAQDLRFLVLDELHTYRGRQGADVAMLVRRLREACQATNLQCVGTSATMATAGSAAAAQEEVARVATRLFGTSISADQVIGETLEPATHVTDGSSGALTAAVDRAGKKPARRYAGRELLSRPVDQDLF